MKINNNRAYEISLYSEKYFNEIHWKEIEEGDLYERRYKRDGPCGF